MTSNEKVAAQEILPETGKLNRLPSLSTLQNPATAPKSKDVTEIQGPGMFTFPFDKPFWPQNPDWRTNVFAAFDDIPSSQASFIISWIIAILIVLSCIIFVLESLPQFRYPAVGTHEFDTIPEFFQIEAFCIAVFTVEYVVRLVFAHTTSFEKLHARGAITPSYLSEPVYKTWLFFIRWMNLIDLLAIVPFYIGLNRAAGLPGGLPFLRFLRLARILRIFKLGKYSEGAHLYSQAIRLSTRTLNLLIFFAVIMSVPLGSIIYYLEVGKFTKGGCDGGKRDCFLRPNVPGTALEESPFNSILNGMWWAFATLMTVGYGDLYPTSFWGKLLGVIAMNIGILGLALPVSILTASFGEMLKQRYGTKSGILQVFDSAPVELVSSDSVEEMKDMETEFEDLVEGFRGRMKEIEEQMVQSMKEEYVVFVEKVAARSRGKEKFVGDDNV